MADAAKKTEFTPQDLIEAKSNVDPQALAPSPSPDAAAPPPGGEPDAEQTRRAPEASEFRNNPERDRDEHLVHVGRGHQTTGRM